MNGPLEGCQTKIERARDRLDELELGVQSFLDTDPYGVTVEEDRDTGQHVYRARVDCEVPATISAITGDVVHSLRTALDHLAWQLVVLNREKPDEKTQFPIFLDQSKYNKWGARMIRGMSPHACAVIEAMQPYRAEKPEGHELWIIHDLDRIDKHRHLNLVGCVLGPHTVRSETGRVGHMVISANRGNIPMEDGTELIRMGAENVELGVQADFSFGVAFQEPEALRRRPVVPQIQALVAKSEELLGFFETALFT